MTLIYSTGIDQKFIQKNATINYLLSNYTGFSINRLKIDPLYDPLRKLPEYKAIVEKYSAEGNTSN